MNDPLDQSEPIPERLMVEVSERLRALGQPVRLRLIEMLASGPSSPQELSDALGLSQQNVSKHLLSLHRAGLVSRRPAGTNVFYELADSRTLTIMELAREGVAERLKSLAALAAGERTSSIESQRQRPDRCAA